MPLLLMYIVHELLAVLVSCFGLTARAFRFYLDDVDALLLRDDVLPESRKRSDGSLAFFCDEESRDVLVFFAEEPAGKTARSCCAVYFFDGTEKT